MGIVGGVGWFVFVGLLEGVSMFEWGEEVVIGGLENELWEDKEGDGEG